MPSQSLPSVSLFINPVESTFLENRILYQQLSFSGSPTPEHQYSFNGLLGKGSFRFHQLSENISVLVFQIKTRQSHLAIQIDEASKTSQNIICIDINTDKKLKFQKAILLDNQFIIPSFSEAKIIIFQQLHSKSLLQRPLILPLVFSAYKIFKRVFENLQNSFTLVFEKYSLLYRLVSHIESELINTEKTTQLALLADTDIQILLLLEKQELQKQAFSKDSLSIEQLAQAACMSPTKFKKIFKIIFNETPHQYFLNYKMDIAQELLKQKNFSISEIAHRVGYNSVGRFSMAFQNRFNVLPSKL